MSKKLLNLDDENVLKALKWKQNNPQTYNKIVVEALHLSKTIKGELSIRDICAKTRWEARIKISNSITPALARIIEADYPQLHFKKNKSRCETEVA